MNGETWTLYHHIRTVCHPADVRDAIEHNRLSPSVEASVDVVADALSAGRVVMYAMSNSLDRIEWAKLATKLKEA